jgi:hypothetical protein
LHDSPIARASDRSEPNQVVDGAGGIVNDVASFLLDVPYQFGRDINTYFPAYHQFCIRRGQVAGVAQVDSGPWRAVGVLPAGKAVVRRQLSNYDSSINTLVLARGEAIPRTWG